jgi:hypothetical protein
MSELGQRCAKEAWKGNKALQRQIYQPIRAAAGPIHNEDSNFVNNFAKMRSPFEFGVAA